MTRRNDRMRRTGVLLIVTIITTQLCVYSSACIGNDSRNHHRNLVGVPRSAAATTCWTFTFQRHRQSYSLLQHELKGEFGYSSFSLPLQFKWNRKCANAWKSMEHTSTALRVSKSKLGSNDPINKTSQMGEKSITKGRRLKKLEIDNIVRGIGLDPVPAAATSSSSTTTSSSSSIKRIETSITIDHTLSRSPEISLQIQLDYSRHGHAALRSFLPTSLIENLRSELIPYAAKNALSAWRQKVEVQLSDSSSEEYHRNNVRSIVDNLSTIEECQELLESFGIDPFDGDLPFLQHFNIWRSSNNDDDNSNNDETTNTPTVRKLCLSSYLAQAASILLNVPSIRLYQDSLFIKRTGDGWTPWHSDARMAPFDTSKMISFWIPLQNVPLPEDGGTGLLFVDGSHSDFALPFWNGVSGGEFDRLEERYGDESVRHHMPLDVGSATVHSGWTLHCADSAEFHGEDGGDRYALSITYVDARAEIREDVVSSPSISKDNNTVKDGEDNKTTAKGDNEDVWSFRSWVQEVEPRTQFRNANVPIVWPLDIREI